MQETFNHFRGGIKFLDLSAQTGPNAPMAGSEDDPLEGLGDLKELRGTWIGAPNDGWNVISIPAGNGFNSGNGFKFEVIPYSEELTFNPKILVGADNVGPVQNGQEHNQSLVGLMYEQIIKSSCTPVSPEPHERQLPNGGTIPANFERTCKFKDGDMIHAETGFFLNIQNFDSGLNLTRLATIPHGNSVLQLGQSSASQTPISDSSFIEKASVEPTFLNGALIGRLGYDGPMRAIQFPDFPAFDQKDPNSALHSGLMYHTIDGRTKPKTILEMTTLQLSTEFDKAGILNIPFLSSNVDATKMTAIFWIQKIQGEKDSAKADERSDYWQLQYTQTIDLVFPAGADPTPIIWPHVTVNTLRRVSDTVAKK